MTWATIEEAWGNYDETKENYTNYHENFQNYDNNKETPPTIKKEPVKKPVKPKKVKQVYKNDRISIDEPNYDIGNENELDKPRVENVYKDYIDSDKIDSIINKKMAELSSKTEKQIYKLNIEIKKILVAINNINKNNMNNTTITSVFNKNIHDILLFIIFGVFIILLLDATYRIILKKIKKL